MDKLTSPRGTKAQGKEMVEEGSGRQAAADRISAKYVRMSGGLELVDRLLETDLASSKILCRAGLREMKLLLKYCDIYRCGDSVPLSRSLARGSATTPALSMKRSWSGDAKDALTANSSPSAVAGGGR